jgi:hypothetical protein
MTALRTFKVAFVSAIAGVALLLGAFMVSSSLAGAQTPSPGTPAPQTEPAPEDDSERTPRDGKECDEERDGSGSSSSTSGVRGRAGTRGAQS